MAECAEETIISNGSSDESLHFFEGVEKLLEIWFEPSPNADLRKIPRCVVLCKPFYNLIVFLNTFFNY